MTTESNDINNEIKTAMHDLAVLISSAQHAHEHVIEWQQALEERVATTDQFIDEQLQKINQHTEKLTAILSATNIQEWQKTATQLQRQTLQPLHLLNQVSIDYKNTLQEVNQKIERHLNQINKNVNQKLNSAHIYQIQHLADECSEQIKICANKAIAEVSHISRWFSGRNLLAALAMSLFGTLLVSLYIGDEWPWELHKDAVQQRAVGRAILEQNIFKSDTSK